MLVALIGFAADCAEDRTESRIEALFLSRWCSKIARLLVGRRAHCIAAAVLDPSIAIWWSALTH
jgi:hypothetical protein